MYESKLALARWVEEEDELSVICIKVMVKGKGGDESTERGSIRSGPRTEPGAHHRRKHARTRGYYRI